MGCPFSAEEYCMHLVQSIQIFIFMIFLVIYPPVRLQVSSEAAIQVIDKIGYIILLMFSVFSC